jgi:hypothetical protein
MLSKRTINHYPKASIDARQKPPPPQSKALPPLPPCTAPVVTATSIVQTTTSTTTPSTPTTQLYATHRSSPRFSATPPQAIPPAAARQVISPLAIVHHQARVSFDSNKDDTPEVSTEASVAVQSSKYTDDTLREIYYRPLPPTHRIRTHILKKDYPFCDSVH